MLQAIDYFLRDRVAVHLGFLHRGVQSIKRGTRQSSIHVPGEFDIVVAPHLQCPREWRNGKREQQAEHDDHESGRQQYVSVGERLTGCRGEWQGERCQAGNRAAGTRPGQDGRFPSEPSRRWLSRSAGFGAHHAPAPRQP